MRRRREPAAMRAGFTLVELMIASLVGLLVLLALSHLLLSNQRSLAAERNRVMLQQELGRCLEEMTRSVRSAHELRIDDDETFRVLDRDGDVVRTFGRVGSGELARLQVGGNGLEGDLVDLRCDAFRVTALDPPQNTGLDLFLSLSDDAGNSVSAGTQVTLRNRTLDF